MKRLDSFKGVSLKEYFVTKEGDIISTAKGKPRKLKPNDNYSGYLYVNIKNKNFYVHRLVATAFIPNPENKREVNHKDGDRSNNRVENLEWVTPSENRKTSYDSGRKVATTTLMKNRIKELERENKELKNKLLGGKGVTK